MSQKYIVGSGWLMLLKVLNLPVMDVLEKANLPMSLGKESRFLLSVDEYYRLWDSILSMKTQSAFPLDVLQAMSPDMFSPPLFAALCSPNFSVALKRLKQYKPLIGPMLLDITHDVKQQTSITLSGLPQDQPLPLGLSLIELLFVVHLIRLGTHENISPVRLELAHDISELGDISAYTNYLGVPLLSGKSNRLVLKQSTMSMPFKTVNHKLWQAFEPQLRKRLHDLDKNASTQARLRAYFFETIASGNVSITNAANQLAMSKRTLQRKLKQEQTNFQTELVFVRKDLAMHYLCKTEYHIAEISFLLGYDDTNSFFRAFHQWTGTTPNMVRKTG